MKTSIVFFLSVGLCLLAGCASDPMKPDRPDGKRVPINLTPPPVEQAVTPPESQGVKKSQSKESSHG